MGKLREKDFRSALDFVGDAYDADDREEFREAMLPGFRRLVPCEYSSYNELAGTRPLAAIAEPDLPPWAVDRWQRLWGENPLLLRFLQTRDGRAVRFTDLRDEPAFRSGPLFTEFYGPLGIDHQIAFVLPSTAELTIAIALSRSSVDFDERERELLELVRPHLIQAYRAAQMRERLRGGLAALRLAVQAAGTAMLMVDESGELEFASAAALELLSDPGGVPLVPGEPLPEAVSGWLAEGDASGRLARPGRGPLLLRREAAGGATVILLAEPGPALPPAKLRELGLTGREAEVLHGLARGAGTAAVAKSLGIAPRTLAKHVQNINAKLGVPSRAEAIAAAWIASGDPLQGDFPGRAS